MRQRPRSLAQSLVVCGVLDALAVHADPVPVRLSWVRAAGAEECPDRSAVESTVSTRLGYVPFAADARRSIEAVVSREGDTWHAHIWVRDPDGTTTGSREISNEAPACGPVADAVALVIAVGIDPDAALRPTTPTPDASVTPGVITTPAHTEPAPPLPTPSNPVSVPPVEERPRRARVRTPARRFGMGVRVSVSAGIIPSPAVGVGVEASVEIVARVHAILAMTLWPEVRATNPAYGFGLTTAELGVCIDLWRTTGVALQGCASALAGVLHAVDYQPIPMTPGDRAWGAVAAGVRFEGQILGPLRAGIVLRALLPIPRYDFTVSGATGPAYVQSPVAGEATLTLGLSF